MYVTLKSLRQEGACYNGYNKVVRYLQGKPFTSEDEERESYIRYVHKKPISLLAIVESNGLQDAIWALRCVPNVDRDARLFAVWCARQVQHLMTDRRSIDALDVAEKFANGEASESELSAAKDAAMDAAMDAAGEAEWSAAWSAAWDAARAAAGSATRAAAGDATRDAAGEAEWSAAWSAAWDAARAAQKEMFIKMCKGEAPWQK